MKLGDIQVEQTVSHEFCVSHSDIEDFRRLSGDSSLIHTDAVFCERHGFKGPIVYGGIMLRQLSKVLGMQMPGVHGLSMGWTISYKKPLYADEAATLVATVTHVSVAARMVKLKFEIRRAEEVIAVGKTESLILE